MHDRGLCRGTPACRVAGGFGRQNSIWIDKGSHKSRRDLRQIYRTSSEPDHQLIRKLAAEMNLLSLLNEVLGESEEFS